MNLYLEFMNETRGAGRSQRLRRGRRGAQLHAGRGEARHLPIGAELHRPPAGGTARRPPPEPTTRSVAPTEAGERLLRTLGPALDKIGAELTALSELREKPAGTVRITAGEHAALTILWPALSKLLPHYPDIEVEVNIDYGLTDIVADRYDAGVRFGEQVAQDMVAVRIGPDFRMAVVGAPSYFARRPKPQEAAGPHGTRLHQSPSADLRRTLSPGSSRSAGAS